MREHGLVSCIEAADILKEYIFELESGDMDTRYGPRPGLDAQRAEEAGRILREKFQEVSMGKAFDELENKVTGLGHRVSGCENVCNDLNNIVPRLEARIAELEAKGPSTIGPVGATGPAGQCRHSSLAGECDCTNFPDPDTTPLHARLCAALGLYTSSTEQSIVDAIKLLNRRIDDMTASRDIVSKQRDELLEANRKLRDKLMNIGSIITHTDNHLTFQDLKIGMVFEYYINDNVYSATLVGFHTDVAERTYANIRYSDGRNVKYIEGEMNNLLKHWKLVGKETGERS